MPEYLRDSLGGIRTDSLGGYLVDTRYDVRDSLGGILDGGRLDPNRAAEDVRALGDDMIARGGTHTYNEVEKLILFRDHREKHYGEHATEFLNAAARGLAGIAGAVGDLPGQALQESKELTQEDPTAAALNFIPVIGPLLSLATSDKAQEQALNVINNVADGAINASAGFQTLSANALSGVVSLLSDDEQEDFRRFSERLDRRQNLTALASQDLRGAVIAEAFDAVAEAFPGDSTIAEVAGEIADKAATGEFATEEVFEGVRLIGEVGGDPTSLLIGPSLTAGRVATSRIAGSALTRSALTATENGVKELAKRVGKTVPGPVAKRISQATNTYLNAKAVGALAGASGILGVDPLLGVVLGGAGAPVIARTARKLFQPQAAASAVRGLLTGNDALFSGLRRIAAESSSPVAARLASNLELLSSPVGFGLRRTRDVAFGAATDFALGFVAEPESLEQAGQEVGEGALFSVGEGATLDLSSERIGRLRQRAIDRFREQLDEGQTQSIDRLRERNPHLDELRLASLHALATGYQSRDGSDVSLEFVDSEGMADAIMRTVGIDPDALSAEDLQVYRDRYGSRLGANVSGSNRTLVNVDKATGKTPFHELFHAMQNLNLGEDADFDEALRTRILGSLDERGNWSGDGLYTTSQLDAFERQYVSRLSSDERLDWYSRDQTDRWNDLAHEVLADYFADWASNRTLTKHQHANAEFGVAYVGGILEKLRQFLGRAFGVQFSPGGDVFDSDHFQELKRDPELSAILADYVNAKNAIRERIQAEETSDAGSIVTGEMGARLGNSELTQNLEGVIFKPGEKDDLGAPVEFRSKREREEFEAEQNQALYSVLDLGDDGPLKVVSKKRGNEQHDTLEIERPLTDDEKEEILTNPNPSVPIVIRERLIKLLDSLQEPGSPLIAQYFAAIKVGRKRSQDRYSSSLKMTTPVFSVLGIRRTGAGNWEVITLDHGHLQRKVDMASKRVLKLWEGNRNALMADIRAVLEGQVQGTPAAQTVGPEKAKAIFDFLDLDQSGGARDRRNSVIRSRRLDRMGSLTPAQGLPIPIDYGKAKARFSVNGDAEGSG